MGSRTRLRAVDTLWLDVEKPGPSKWGWPTVNYMGAILVATQMHHAGGFVPSFRPTLQFQTRYSRLIWARDVIAVPAAQAANTVAVNSPERLWWQRLVYQRKTQRGHDLIVHLVRIPPTPEWDLGWVDEPTALKGVTITAHLGAQGLAGVQACRPYHFEEAQQVVQQALAPSVRSGKATVHVPPFRYHTMVLFRMKTK